jgi:hypothetical protein
MASEIRNGRVPGRKYTGTPIFSAGAKLHLGEIYGGMAEKLHVIGVGRNSSRLVNAVIGFDLLRDIRPKLIYSPARLKSLERLNAFLTPDQSEAQKLAEYATAQRRCIEESLWADPGSLDNIAPEGSCG